MARFLRGNSLKSFSADSRSCLTWMSRPPKNTRTRCDDDVFNGNHRLHDFAAIGKTKAIIAEIRGKNSEWENARGNRIVGLYAFAGDRMDSHFISATLNFGWDTKRCQIMA